MTFDECTKLLSPALLNLFGENTVGKANKLDSLLGVTHYADFCARNNAPPLPDEIRNLYIALAGPHAKTVLKIWQIRKGLNDDGSPKAHCEAE